MSTQDTNVHTLPPEGHRDHPLSLARTLERALDWLEVGDIDDATAALKGALTKAREAESHPANKPAEVPAFMIADLLHGTDYELGRYINEGKDGNRRRAVREALLNAQALTDALSSADHEAFADFTAVQLARIANTMLRRAQELDAEGNSDTG